MALDAEGRRLLVTSSSLRAPIYQVSKIIVTTLLTLFVLMIEHYFQTSICAGK